jgi:RNA polymerase sigma-70 factor (ECF subfamily)
MEDSNDLNQLIKLSIAGNREAFSGIYEKINKDISQTVRFLIEDKSDSEDIIQEIYIQLYKSLPGFDLARPFRPWLMGLVTRQVSSYRRKRWMRFRILNKKTQQRDEIVEPDFSGTVAEKLFNQQLLQRIENLPYKLKQVVILHYLNEYTQEEVAQILDIPHGTVKSRIHSALQKLRPKESDSAHYLRKAENKHEF